MPYSAVAKLIQKLQLYTANSIFAGWNALIFYIRETVNFAAIIFTSSLVLRMKRCIILDCLAFFIKLVFTMCVYVDL